MCPVDDDTCVVGIGGRKAGPSPAVERGDARDQSGVDNQLTRSHAFDGVSVNRDIRRHRRETSEGGELSQL